MTDLTASPSPQRPRRRRLPWIAAGVAVLVVAGLAAAYFAFFRGSSAKRLALTPSAGPPSSAGAATAGSGGFAGHWSASAGSQAGYRVREKLAQLPAQSDAVGRTTAVSGGMTVAGAGDHFVARDLRIDVDVTQLRSNESRRDNRIRTQGLETTRFPSATFVSVGDISAPADATSGKPFSVDVIGDLTIHGVTKRVTIPVQGELGADGLQVVGSYKFPMSMFDITPPNIGGFVTVEPDATLELKILMKQG